MQKASTIVRSTRTESPAAFLKRIAFFSGFPDEEIQLVLKNARTRDYDKGRLLFLIGDQATHFFIVLNGWVKLFRETRDGNEVVISVLSRGDTFGKATAFAEGRFPYSAEIIDDKTALLEIPAAFVRKMAESHDRFDHLMAKLLQSRYEDINQLGLQREHLTIMTSAQRVACFLLRLCRDRCEGSITLRLPYEKSLVAGVLGMQPETFSRSLNQLTEVGVETKNSAVTIHNIAQLQAYVCSHCSAIRSECPVADEEDFL